MFDKMLLIFVILCFNAKTQASNEEKPVYSLVEQDLKQLFAEFINTYDKEYGDDEELNDRFEIFKQNVAIINTLNADPHETAVFDINTFSDLTSDEFMRTYGGFKPEVINIEEGKPDYYNENSPQYTQLPEAFDWRSKGNVVTDVRDIGTKETYCYFDWGLAITGVLEGAYGIKHGDTKQMSAGQLLDCDYYNWGCAGGNMIYSLEYIKESGGLMSEKDYPYIGEQKPCKFDKNKVEVKIEEAFSYDLQGENDTKQFLVENGPIGIKVYPDNWQYYKKGILKVCRGCVPFTNMLLVGYGREKHQKYYIIKNSWSKAWGEEGYIRVEITKNPCVMYNNIAVGVKVA